MYESWQLPPVVDLSPLKWDLSGGKTSATRNKAQCALHSLGDWKQHAVSQPPELSDPCRLHLPRWGDWGRGEGRACLPWRVISFFPEITHRVTAAVSCPEDPHSGPAQQKRNPSCLAPPDSGAKNRRPFLAPPQEGTLDEPRPKKVRLPRDPQLPPAGSPGRRGRHSPAIGENAIP